MTTRPATSDPEEASPTDGGREIDLDPRSWDDFRFSAHATLDRALDQMATVRDRPPWRPVPETVRQALRQGAPREGQELDAVLAEYWDRVAPYPTGNGHPCFWGWVMGNGTADGMLADMLASASNPHLAGYDQSASLIEETVVAWLADLLGYPAGAGGLLVSGGTVANLTGLAVARRAIAPFDVRERGLSAAPRLRAYGSVETHSWVEKSCDLLGLGRGAFRRVPANMDTGRVDIAALAAAIARDRGGGEVPFCVVANAGTVDAGAIDDLEALADLCADEGLWLHVDGAFGALVALVPELRPRLRGLERADSLAFDLHKWGYLQYEVGCVLVRDRAAHRATFATSADYLESPGRGIQPGPLDFPQLGIQLSRGFRALKVWFALKHHGSDKIGRVIAQNVGQAQRLVRRIGQEPCLELLGPAPLNVVCFRFRDDATPASSADWDAVNREILLRIQERGVAVPSSTRRSGALALRVAITNHRTTRDDIDRFAEAVIAVGAEVCAEARQE